MTDEQPTNKGTCCDIDPKRGPCKENSVQDGFCGFHWSMHEMFKEDIGPRVAGVKRKGIPVIRECIKKQKSN